MSYIRLYEAENNTDWSPKAAARLDELEAQRLATKALGWLRSKGYKVPLNVKVIMSRGSGSYAFPGRGKIHFGKERPLRFILLHEVAHLVSHHKADMPGWYRCDEDTRSHGRAFMVAYLDLLGHYCGTADKRALMAECRKRGVKYRPRRRRDLTDEQRAELAARLAAHRPAASPHRYAYRKTVETDRGPVHVYVSSRRSDTAQWTNPGRESFSATSGTTYPNRAVTRTTPERLAAWADQNGWWTGPLDDGTYEVVDIADLIIPDRRAAAASPE